MRQGRRWTVGDAWGNAVYLTDERWEHICERHSVLAPREPALRETIRRGRRWQDAADPRKYRYRFSVPDLPGENTHIEAVVLFRFIVDDDGTAVANNYIVTAYPKELW